VRVRRDGGRDKRTGAGAGDRRRSEPVLAEPFERADVKRRAARATLEGDAYGWIEGKDQALTGASFSGKVLREE
jgi:hypothetical protein